MSEEFEDRDLTGAVFWGVRLRDARLRDVDFTGVRSHHVILHDVEFDGLIDRLVVNGVDVTDYVNQHDPWQPLRGLQQPRTADDIRRSLTAFMRAWDELIADALERPSDHLATSVDGEWSFIETLRHLIFAADKWIVGPLGGGPWSPIGLPNSGSAEFDWPGIERDRQPAIDEVLDARTAQARTLSILAGSLRDERLDDGVVVLENGRVTVTDCWHVLLEELFEHRRYALRDLALLGRATGGVDSRG